MKRKSKSSTQRFADAAAVIEAWRSLGAPTFDHQIETVAWADFRKSNDIRDDSAPAVAAAWVKQDSLEAYNSIYKGPLYVANVLGRMKRPEMRTVEFIRCAYWEFRDQYKVRWLPADWRDRSNVLEFLNDWMGVHAPEWLHGYGNCRYFLPGGDICCFSRPRSVKACICDTWEDCASEVDELTRVAHHTTQAMQKWRLVRFDAYEFWGQDQPDDVPSPPRNEEPMGVVLNFPFKPPESAS